MMKMMIPNITNLLPDPAVRQRANGLAYLKILIINVRTRYDHTTIYR